MKYDVLIYGDESLRAKAAPVKMVDAAIRKLAREMLETMYASQGLGLAAQQVGRTESICVIDVPREMGEDSASGSDGERPVGMPLIMINPRVTARGGVSTCREGCLSFPELFVPIKRAAEVTATFVTLENKEATVRARGVLARAIQHELDHLDGILLVDRMSVIQKVATAGALKKLKARGAARQAKRT